MEVIILVMREVKVEDFMFKDFLGYRVNLGLIEEILRVVVLKLKVF